MSEWNAMQYLKFREQRTQPATDLAARIMKFCPRTIVDIGCGPGNSTAVLADFFPGAALTGIDTSPDMIRKARADHPDLHFELCGAMSLAGQYDLLFSNACLQWIPDHHFLIPSLMNRLNAHGILAVQMPMNRDEPLFRLIEEVAREERWGLQNTRIHAGETLLPSEYSDILSACSSWFDIWETKYYHRLAGHKDLVHWVKGARLRPYLDALGEAKGAAFEEELVKRSQELYPVTERGEVILGFRRFFFVAVK